MIDGNYPYWIWIEGEVVAKCSTNANMKIVKAAICRAFPKVPGSYRPKVYSNHMDKPPREGALKYE